MGSEFFGYDPSIHFHIVGANDSIERSRIKARPQAEMEVRAFGHRMIPCDQAMCAPVGTAPWPALNTPEIMTHVAVLVDRYEAAQQEKLEREQQAALATLRQKTAEAMEALGYSTTEGTAEMEFGSFDTCQARTLRQLSLDHLGPDATDSDLMQFKQAVKIYQQRTGLPEDVAIASIWNNGDFLPLIERERGLA